MIIIISTFQWFVDGRKNFTGPRTEMGLEVIVASDAGVDAKSPTDEDALHGKKFAEAEP